MIQDTALGQNPWGHISEVKTCLNRRKVCRCYYIHTQKGWAAPHIQHTSVLQSSSPSLAPNVVEKDNK